VDATGGPPFTGLRFSRGVVPLEAAVTRAGEAAPPDLRGRPFLLLLVARGAATVDRCTALLDGLDGKGDLDDLLLPDPRLLLPFRPNKVIAVGRNYAAHAREMGSEAPAEPFFFMKAPSTAVGPGDPVVIPWDVEGEVHHEAELAVVVGRFGRRIPESRAADWIAGYACANDVTARTVQKRLQEERLPWFSGKNADSFLPLGPGLTLAGSVPDPAALRVQGLVNGEVRQDAPTSGMIHPVAALLARVSRHVSLEPLDVILTGTPAGVGPLRPGDAVEVRIEGVGSLVNPVVAEEEPA